jgi:BirA family biotin operon repressor/biotin-[acetyl-CoA-carboxylase] ligase
MTNSELEQLADKVLEKIRSHHGQPLEPTKLADLYKTSEEEIISSIGILRNWGYTIKADKERRYIFVNAPDNYLSTEILYNLETKFMGKRIYTYYTVQSTNAIASQLAIAKSPEGTLVISEHQTRGRGRLGRNWHSPEKVGLYCSLVLYPKIHPTLAPGISIVTAVSLADTIASYDDIDVKIKWPNDILISGLKVAGILIELSAEIDRIEHIVVGVGVNLNQIRSDFPEELRKQATSVRIGTKEKIRRVEFLQRFLKNFERDYAAFKKYGLKDARKKITKYSSLHNKEVKLKMGRKTIIGIVIDIDEQGRLVLDTKEGIMNFNAGEVTTH